MDVKICDRCGALDMENRFVTFRAENDASWRLDLCMECSAWLRRVLEDRRKSQMIKIEVNCPYCGTQLVFPWHHINFLNREEWDSDHQWFYECAVKIGYIDCPDCGKRIFLRRDDSGWTSGIKKADGTYLWRKLNELSRT